MEQTTAQSTPAPDLLTVAKGICAHWDTVVPSEFVNAQHLALRNAIQQHETAPIAVAGLGRVTNDEDGVLTLQFKDEDAAHAFMHRYECTVDVDQMAPSRDTISTAPLAQLSDDQLDELHERLEAKVRAAVKAAPAGVPNGARVERRMYLRELLSDLRQAL